MLRAQKLLPRIPPRLPAAADPRSAAASDSSTGPSATTCGSRRRTSRRPRRTTAAAPASGRRRRAAAPGRAATSSGPNSPTDGRTARPSETLAYPECRCLNRGTGRMAREASSDERYDVVICGASFAGLAVARELAGSGRRRAGRRPLRDRRAPDLGLRDPDRVAAGAGPDGRRAPALRHAGHAHPPRRRPLPSCPTPSRPSTTASSASCSGASATPSFETAKVNGRAPAANGDGAIAVETDRGTISAPLVVDALGWRRMLANGDGYQPPDAPLSRGLEVHPGGDGEDLEVWIDRRYVPRRLRLVASRPATSCGSGSAPSTRASTSRETTELLAEDLGAEPGPLPGQLDPAQAAPGDRGRRLLRRRLGRPLPAAHAPRGSGPRSTSGSPLGRELRGVVEGWQSREQAAASYAEFNDSHEWKFRWMLRVQKLIPRIPPRLLGPADPR